MAIVSRAPVGLARCALAAVHLLALAGCANPTERYSETYGDLRPTRFVLVMPEGRQHLAAVQRFLEYKAGEGLDVQLLHFDPEAPAADRFAHVRDDLAAARSEASDPAYLLILADADELPMGPWPVQGRDDPVESEIPLLLGRPIELGQTLADDDWEEFMTGPPVWIAGRLPYSDPGLLSRILDETLRFETASAARGLDALLGGERFALPSDTGRILSKARDELRAQGWRAELWSEDKPRDVDLEERTRLTTAALNGEASDAAMPLAFIEHWARESPILVYTIAHASGVGTIVGSGRMLIVPRAFLHYAHEGVWNDLGAPEHPATPSVLVSTGCTLGRPDNRLLAELFKHRWICACAGSTETNGPLPLGPAINAEVNIARFLAEGMPLGIAVHATRHCYVDQASRDLTAWWPGTAETKRVNLLTYVIYGDPSLRLLPSAALAGGDDRGSTGR